MTNKEVLKFHSVDFQEAPKRSSANNTATASNGSGEALSTKSKRDTIGQDFITSLA